MSASPIDTLMGDPNGGCRRFAENVAMHWYPRGSRPGDKCHCGEMVMTDDGSAPSSPEPEETQ